MEPGGEAKLLVVFLLLDLGDNDAGMLMRNVSKICL